MSPERWLRVKDLLSGALELPPAEQSGYLDQACAGDAELRAELDSLLAAARQAETFLESPAFDAEHIAPHGTGSTWIGRRVGSYEIVAEIGHGGMGEVYEAIRADHQFQQQVAIKLVRHGYNSDFLLARFRAERQILATLSHPNIARLLDGGITEDGIPYFVMELIDGRPIDRYCSENGLPLVERLRLFRTVCAAVQYAHQHLVVHRDIKPSNILVTADGLVKLLDFGIAKMLDRDATTGAPEPTATRFQALTPEFASPEQLRGEPVTTVSDVYSLGVLLYHLLADRGPYPLRSNLAHEVAREIVETQPERPSTVVRRALSPDTRRLQRRLKGDLDNIVLMALRKEPERRYASAEQLSEDIRRHLSGEPVIARQDTVAYRAAKFVQRHSVAVGAAATVVVSLSAGIVAVEREARIARAERARAEQHFNEVRKLANTFMFEFHDAIQNLPGATPARQLLVKSALAYLDPLAREAGDDQALQRELATAYEKMGDVQGGFRSASLGDMAGALASYRKALAIRESLARTDPQNAALLREVIRSHGKLGDLLLGSGDPPAALDEARRLLAVAQRLQTVNPDDDASRRIVATAYLDYGWKRAQNGDWQAGIEDCRKAAGMYEVLLAAAPADKLLRRQLALTYSRTAGILVEQSDNYGDALALHQRALALAEVLLEDDAKNTDLRTIAAWERIGMGQALSLRGDAPHALTNYRAALRDLEALAAEDPKNARFRYNAAFALSSAGDALLQLGENQAALDHVQRAIADLLTLPDAKAAGSEAQLAIALSQFRLGKAYARSAAEGGADRRRQVQYWKMARDAYRESMPILTEARERRLLARHERELAEEAAREIGKCDEALASAHSVRL